MLDLWLFFIVTGFLFAVLIVVSAYSVSSMVVRPKSLRKPVSVFPDQFNLVHENITFRTADGIKIFGWFIPAPEWSDKTIIVLAGRGQNRGEILSSTWFLHKHGFNLMYFDFRGMGDSGGEESSVGYLELRDFDAALEFLKRNKEEEAKNIGVYGLSMGGAVALYQTANRPEIKCVAAEAAFESFNNVAARWAWTNRKIPNFPIVRLGLMMVRLRLGVDPEPFSPIYHIAKISPRPVLFIVGSHDPIVPVKDAQQMFNAARNPKEMWITHGASHAKCAEVGGEEYKNRLSEFFTKNL